MTSKTPWSTPDEVPTSIGTLRFLDARPDPDTVARLADHLLSARAVEAFLATFPVASVDAIHRGFLAAGINDGDVLIYPELTDGLPLLLTANADTVYAWMFLDPRDGPVAIQAPPDMDRGHRRPGLRMGRRFRDTRPGPRAGRPLPGRAARLRRPASGRGLRHLPRQDHPRHHRRAGVPGGRPPGTGGREHQSQSADRPVRAWRLRHLARFLPQRPGADASGRTAAQPAVRGRDQARTRDDPARRPYLFRPHQRGGPGSARRFPRPGDRRAARRHRHRQGKRVPPADHDREIIEDAARIANAAARVISYRERADARFAYYGDTQTWLNSLFISGYDFLGPPALVTGQGLKPFPPTGARTLDARTGMFYMATLVTPAMAMRVPGIGSAYLVAVADSGGNYFDGANTYSLTLPAGIPAAAFWSITVYDNQSRSMLRTPQRYPRAGSQDYPTPAAETADDGTTIIWFAPAPAEDVARGNWVQTLPDRGWFAMLRLYSPTPPFFEKSWKPGDVIRH